MLVIVGLIILSCGGCFAVTGAFFNEVDKEIKKSEKEDKLPGGPDNPMTIKPGKAFEVQGFQYHKGWKVTDDGLGSVNIAGLKVTNNRDEKDSAVVEIKFWNGTEVLALADCTTDSIAVGTTVKVDCLSGDDLPKDYDKITINDTF